MIVRKTIDENLFMFLLALALLMAICAFNVVLWEAAEQILDELLDFLKEHKLPRMLIKNVQKLILGQFPLWIAVRWFLFNSLFLVSLLAVLFGIGPFARERSRGTFEWLLSLPTSRTQIFVEKTGVGLIMLAVCNYVPSVLVIRWTSPVIMEDISPKLLFHTATVQMSIFLLLFSFATLCSVLCRDQVRAGGAAFAFLGMMLALGMRREYRKLSPFYWSDLPRLKKMLGVFVKAPKYPWQQAGIMAAIALALLVIAWLLFLRTEP